MSDTPRTDAVAPDFRAGAYDRLENLARTLERELNETSQILLGVRVLLNDSMAETARARSELPVHESHMPTIVDLLETERDTARRERDEARACLLEAIKIYFEDADRMSVYIRGQDHVARWRKAAGLDGTP